MLGSISPAERSIFTDGYPGFRILNLCGQRYANGAQILNYALTELIKVFYALLCNGNIVGEFYYLFCIHMVSYMVSRFVRGNHISLLPGRDNHRCDIYN